MYVRTGAFGVGVDAHVLEAYTFFSQNYAPGDELFLFGFSRGAFTARAIASLICNVSSSGLSTYQRSVLTGWTSRRLGCSRRSLWIIFP